MDKAAIVEAVAKRAAEWPVIEDGFCHCGCGKRTNIAESSNSRRGVVKGQPYRFIRSHGAHRRIPRCGYSEGGIRIPLTQGQTCLISPEDSDLTAFRWHVNASGYALRTEYTTTGKQIPISLHRIVLERTIGRLLLPEEEGDHKNGSRLDNRRENLRVATHQQNVWNIKRSVRNTSGFRGVTYNKATGKWRAQIQINKVEHSLGYFVTPEEASATYEAAAAAAFGEWLR